MILLPLLVCVVLRALGAQARVVTSFTECSSFFYNNKEPEGMDQNGIKICQKFETTDYFATLYSGHNKIPIYSAYKFNNPKKRTSNDDKDCTEDTEDCNNSKKWSIEPQLSRSNMKDSMQPESEYDVDFIKSKQAISADYFKSGFDRGHLNPNAFQSGKGRTATYTLTNAAPMDPCFNRVIWRAWEDSLRFSELSNLDTQPETATAYLVTGTVPSQDFQIPQGRVKVPTHVWTALCYKHKEVSKSFSLGFIGQNKPDGVVTVMSIPELNVKLQCLYRRSQDIQVKIFADECFSNNARSVEVRENLLNNIQKPKAERLEMLVSAIENVENPINLGKKRPREGNIC